MKKYLVSIILEIEPKGMCGSDPMLRRVCEYVSTALGDYSDPRWPVREGHDGIRTEIPLKVRGQEIVVNEIH